MPEGGQIGVEETDGGKGIGNMIKVLFVCRSNIPKSPQKASKINGFTLEKGVCYTITTPF